MQRYPLPYAFARTHCVLLEEKPEGAQLTAAPNTPLAILGEVARHHAVESLAQEGAPALLKRIEQAYEARQQDAASILDAAAEDSDLSRVMQELPPVEDLLEANDGAPITRMINALLTQAAREGASDIHIEAYERYSTMRLRVDGELREIARPNRALHAALISRLKVMAQLDIAEKRLPQDGRIPLRIGSRSIDVRLSTLPGVHGERGVLRLLDKSQTRLRLTDLGMSAQTLGEFERLIRQPHGVLLVTGPTGSGKTTTLYTALSMMDAEHINILTVEDPVEYDLPGIGQTQVHSKIGLTFAAALRSILRQDPDVIMIGEIRDHETAQIAIQASLTGHLVLATLHTNDAASAVTRLIDMGVEPFLLSSSLLGVLAQRLLRKIKPGSAGEYSGRTGIFELLSIDDSIRALIHSNQGEAVIRAAAQKAGMVLIREDGERLVTAGITTREELLRVTKD